MTALSNAEGRALLAGLKGKGSPKRDKPPPIKMPKEAQAPEPAPHSPAMATQLGQTALDKVLTEVVIRTPEMAYVAHYPGRLEITYKGHELVLVPREQVKEKYLTKDNN